MVKLNEEVAQALMKCHGEPLTVEVSGSNRHYVIVEADVHRSVVEAAERQRIHESIKKGFEDIKAGLGKPVEDAFSDIRKRLEEQIGTQQ